MGDGSGFSPRDFARTSGLMSFVGLAMVAIGAVSLLREGLSRPWISGFPGDFSSVYYGTGWWNANEVSVAPILTLTGQAIKAFQIPVSWFWILTLTLITASVLVTIRQAKLHGSLILLYLGLVTFSGVIYLPLSSTAFPEALQVFLLVLVWKLVSKSRFALAWVLFACAVMTKLSPLVLAPILLFTGSWRRIWIGVLTAGLLLILITFTGPIDFVDGVLDTLWPARQTSFQGYTHVDGDYRGEFKGPGSALARLLGVSESNANTVTFTAVWISFVIIILALAWIAAYRIMRHYTTTWDKIYLAAAFGLLMAASPILNTQAHAYSFLTLIPTFAIVLMLLGKFFEYPIFLAANVVLLIALSLWLRAESLLRIIFPAGYPPTFFEDPLWPSLLIALQIVVLIRRGQQLGLLPSQARHP